MSKLDILTQLNKHLGECNMEKVVYPSARRLLVILAMQDVSAREAAEIVSNSRYSAFWGLTTK